ncbi:hypothetical protein [Tsukamurella serpentis]
MATQDEFPGRGRARIRNLASAALNADMTIDQATAMLDGMAVTLENMSATMATFDETVARVNRNLDEFERLTARFSATLEKTDAALEKVNLLLAVPGTAVTAAERMLEVPGQVTRRLFGK